MALDVPFFSILQSTHDDTWCGMPNNTVDRRFQVGIGREWEPETRRGRDHDS
jgi:hypothetical protein